MNELVRVQLSDKKMIKDLFLAVLQALEIRDNMKVITALVSFVTNLCYGTQQGRFRTLLRNHTNELMQQTQRMLTFIHEQMQGGTEGERRTPLSQDEKANLTTFK